MNHQGPTRRQLSAFVAMLAATNAMAWTWIVWAGARLAQRTVPQVAHLTVAVVAASVVPVAILSTRRMRTAGDPLGDHRPSNGRVPV